MNPKSFPKRLDSKTGCLRITVPENLDLALEGLIRKVLREQPKTDDIYAFAANYFETLLRIRDEAGVEYTTTQLCPFHNDEEAREMIVLAGTFPKRVPGKVQGKGPAALKTENKEETDKVELEKGLKISKETLKDSKPEAEKKQATPDLIKKLPLLAQNQGLNREETGVEIMTDLMGPEPERTETVKEGGDEEEYLTSDPIKEFVEKELLTEENSREKVAEGEAPEHSERGSQSPTAREGQNEESEGGAQPLSNGDGKKGADSGDNPRGGDIVGGVIQTRENGGTPKIDPAIRETDEKGIDARDVAEDAEDKIGDATQSETGEEQLLQETQQKNEKENEKESSKLLAEVESQNEMESAPETESEPEGVEAPLPPLPPSPGAAEKHAQELVQEVWPTYNAEADVSFELEGGKVTQNAAFPEVASPQEKGISEVGGVQQAVEDKSVIDAQPGTASPTKTDEESPETSSPATNSYDSKPVENDDALAAETDKTEKSDRKEETNSATESVALGEGEDPKAEAASERTERRTNSSETGSSPERAKDVQEVEEGGESFEKGDSNKEREKQDTKADDPGKPDLKSTEAAAKLISAGAMGAEHAAGQLQMGAEDSTAEPGEEKGTELSGKLDLVQKARGLEILKQEQFSHSHVTGSDREAEPKIGDEEGKAGGDKKLSDEEVKAEDPTLTERQERQESPGNEKSPEEVPLQKVEDVQGAAETPTEESTGSDDRRIPLMGISSTTEGPKSEEQGDAKQEAPGNRSSPTGDAIRLTEAGETPEIATGETESAKPQEFKTEGAPTAENETASLANEELCSVVDIDHLKKGGGNQEEPKLAKPRPENTAEGKPAPEPEAPSQSLSPSAPNGETWGENRNNKLSSHRESEAEGETQGKEESEELPNPTAVREPLKSETDKEKDSTAEGTPAETWEGFDPSAEGKQIIIVEEPETTKGNPEESSPPGEIQIKTIQTHYYDTLRVPETVTREYRVHEVVAPRIEGLLGAASPPLSTHDEVQVVEERSEKLAADNAVPPAPKNSPTSDGDVSPYAEAAEAELYIGPPYQPSHEIADVLLAADGLDRDAQASDSDDLPHLMTPTSDVASNVAELSLQAASETFLTNEKRFSSLENEEIRFVTPTTEEARKSETEEQVIESGREIDEGGDETALPSTGGARPAPQEPGKTEVAGTSAVGAEDVKQDGERPARSSGGSPALSDGRPANGDSPIDSASEKPVSEPRPRGDDENLPGVPPLPSGIKPDHAADVQRRTAAGSEGADKESFHSSQKTLGRNVLESCPEEVQVGSLRDDRSDGRSTQQTSTGEASHAETDPKTAQAKGADSARRDFASARGLSSARSLDFGKRNPLVRTRSLSTHRHGVADFEVWSTIEKELEEAATKIQSKFRGYSTRKKLRREVAVQISTEESSKASTPVEADDADNRPRATGELHDGIVLADHPR